MTDFVLHAGVPKTGTSTLQRAVFQGHSQIFYLGKCLNSGYSRECRSEQTFKILDPLFWHAKPYTNYAKLKRQYDTHILPQALNRQIILASWESLGTSNAAEFEKLLKRTLAFAPDMKLMIGLRNPLTWVGSQYLQHLQGHYILENRDWYFKQCPYLSFENWLENVTELKGGIEAWLCFAQNIKNAMSMIDRENIGVFLFEELGSKPTEYYTSVARFLNIDGAEVLQLVTGLHHNKRLLQAQVDFMEFVNASDSRRKIWRGQSPRERRKKLRAIVVSPSEQNEPAEATLSGAWKVRIENATREGNNWLSRNLGLDMGKYGYPL